MSCKQCGGPKEHPRCDWCGSMDAQREGVDLSQLYGVEVLGHEQRCRLEWEDYIERAGTRQTGATLDFERHLAALFSGYA